jgi:tetratricopeptide (TPR) repeat protein
MEIYLQRWLLIYLAATQWDHVLFDACFNVILSQLGNSYSALVTDLIEAMPKIAANFYYLPGTENTLANIGVFFQLIQDYKMALQYYQRSKGYFDNVDTVSYNMGLCHYFLQEYPQALAKFHEAVTINPHYIMAKGWIAQIESETIIHQ